MPASPYDLTDRVAIVTGGGTGIGRATALLLAHCGADVVVAARKQERLEETVRLVVDETGRKAVAVATDVRDEAAVQALVDTTVETFGRLDIVVNNAGGAYMKLLRDMTVAEWEKCVSLNLTSAFVMTKAALPHLKVNGGSIVNVSSAAASSGTIGGSAYGAAKAGLEMFTKVSSAELGPSGIRVNCVAPGLIRSEGAERSWDRAGLDTVKMSADIPVRRVGEPDELANAIVFLASDAATYITGEVLHATGGPRITGISLD